MPMGLVLVIAKSLGIKESDIRMTLAGNMFHVEFPNEKLIIQRMGTEKLTLDARLMLDMGLDESLSGQRITMQTLRILHKNMYQHGMGLDIIPMFGVSQSGKSSLLNFCLGVTSPESAASTRLANPSVDERMRMRVGNGGQSKTSLVYQHPINGSFVTDTPGLGDSRGTTMNLVIHYQLVELLMSNQLKKIVWTLTKSDFIPPFTSNGIRSMMDFFSGPFDIKQMGDGFYNTLFDDHFKIDGLDPVSPEEVDARLTGFLEALDQKVTDMPTSPFLVVIRDNEEDLDEDEKLTKQKLTQKIDKNLTKLKKTVLANLKENGFAFTPNAETTLLYIFYLFLIKKDMEVGNLAETNDDLRRKVVESDGFDFRAITNRRAHLNEYEKTLSEQIKEVLTPYNDLLRSVELKEAAFQAEVAPLVSNIRTLVALESEFDPRAIQKEINRLEGEIGTYHGGIQILTDDITTLNASIARLDTDDVVDKEGFPKTITAKSHLLWSYMQYVESGCDPRSLTVDSRDLRHLTKVVGYNYVLYRYPWRHPKGLSYKATVHNYTTKKQKYKIKLEEDRASLVDKRAKLTQNKSALERAEENLQQLKNGIKSKEHKEECITIAKTNIKENLATLGRLATESRESYQELQANHDDLSILHELLSDSKVTYLQSITHEYKDSFVSAFRSIYIGR